MRLNGGSIAGLDKTPTWLRAPACVWNLIDVKNRMETVRTDPQNTLVGWFFPPHKRLFFKIDSYTISFVTIGMKSMQSSLLGQSHQIRESVPPQGKSTLLFYTASMLVANMTGMAQTVAELNSSSTWKQQRHLLPCTLEVVLLSKTWSRLHV